MNSTLLRASDLANSRLKRGSAGELSPADENAPTTRLELATRGLVTARANYSPGHTEQYYWNTFGGIYSGIYSLGEIGPVSPVCATCRCHRQCHYPWHQPVSSPCVTIRVLRQCHYRYSPAVSLFIIPVTCHLKVESEPAEMEEWREWPWPPPLGGASRLRASRPEVRDESSPAVSSRAAARFLTRLPTTKGAAAQWRVNHAPNMSASAAARAASSGATYSQTSGKIFVVCVN